MGRGQRPGETFLPLDVDFDEDKDVVRLSRYTRRGEARACRDLLVAMWRYCKRGTTDGHVPFEAVGKLVYPDPSTVGIRDADRLVECGIAERTDTGYYFPGYLKRNKSRAELLAEHERKAEAGRKGGVHSGEARRKQTRSTSEAPASVWLNTETETENRDRELVTEGGQRNETSATADATKPPHDPTRCKDHQRTDDPPRCRGCKLAREAYERESSRSHLAVVADCDVCGGTGWIETEDGQIVRKCSHTGRNTA